MQNHLSEHALRQKQLEAEAANERLANQMRQSHASKQPNAIMLRVAELLIEAGEAIQESQADAQRNVRTAR